AVVGGDRERVSTPGAGGRRAGQGRGAVVVVRQRHAVRDVAGRRQGGGREPGRGDGERPGRADGERGGDQARDRRGLVDRQGEGLRHIRPGPVVGGDRQRVRSARVRGRRP